MGNYEAYACLTDGFTLYEMYISWILQASRLDLLDVSVTVCVYLVSSRDIQLV